MVAAAAEKLLPLHLAAQAAPRLRSVAPPALPVLRAPQRGLRASRAWEVAQLGWPVPFAEAHQAEQAALLRLAGSLVRDGMLRVGLLRCAGQRGAGQH